MPLVWLKSIITPIPKGAKCDPCVPLNYRGISLLRFIPKAYSCLINTWITRYLEETNFLVSEYNGFWKISLVKSIYFS